MPDRPKIFGTKARKHAGGSSIKRDNTRAYQALRKSVLAENPLCVYCLASGRLATPSMCVDHIIALSIAGSNDRANLCGSCVACNQAKRVAELAFVAKGYDPRDVKRDPNLALWLALAEAGQAISADIMSDPAA